MCLLSFSPTAPPQPRPYAAAAASSLARPGAGRLRWSARRSSPCS